MMPDTAPTVLFVSDTNFLDTTRLGGVQRCTQDYLALLHEAGLAVKLHPVRSTRRIGPRVKVRLGVEAYELYDVDALAPEVVRHAQACAASVVALNQMSLIGLAPHLRAALPGVRVVVLSHGNESGDVVHEMLRAPHIRPHDEWRMGRLILREAEGLAHVDAVLCLSETEAHINRWLGTAPAIVVPRTWTLDFLDAEPVPGRVGFVGTLDHLPNVEGLGRVLDALAVATGGDASGVDVRIVGGPEQPGRDLAARFAGTSYLGRLSDADFADEARTWSLFLNPVWWTSRGASTKLAQALGWGLPVATTEPGRRGYEWHDGELLTTDTPAAMAEAILDTVRDPARTIKVTEAARRVARSGPSLADVAARVRPYLLGAEH